MQKFIYTGTFVRFECLSFTVVSVNKYTVGVCPNYPCSIQNQQNTLKHTNVFVIEDTRYCMFKSASIA
jgi:hypothetical protein